MKLHIALFALLAVTGSIVSHAQDCETAPMEGYFGTCALTAVVTPDSKFVFTSNGKSIKKWDIATKQVVGDWPAAQTNTLLEVYDEGHYIFYVGSIMESYGLFDTQTGSSVAIDGYRVCAVLPKFNVAVVVPKGKNELWLYDLTTKKRKYLGESKEPYIAEKAGRIAWKEDESLYVVDIASGKKIFSKRVGSFSDLFVFSPDGKYLAHRDGIIDLDTKKETPIRFEYQNPGAQFVFAPDGQHLFFVRNDSEYQRGDWMYGFGGLQKYNIATGQLELDVRDAWANGTLVKEVHQRVFVGDDHQLYLFDGQSLALVSEESIRQRSFELKFVGGMGEGGKAKMAKAEEEKEYLETLKELMKPKFSALQPSDFNFPLGNHLKLYDYNSASGVVMIGNSRTQVGIWKMPEGKLLQSYGNDISHMRVGDLNHATQVNMLMSSGAVSPDGVFSSVSNETEGSESTDVFKNGILEARLGGIVMKFMLNDHQGIAWTAGDKKLSLYDFKQRKAVTTYSAKDMGTLRLSPDGTKLLVGGERKVFDVQSGKVLLATKEWLSDISNRYAIEANQTSFSLYDLTTGKYTVVKGLDDSKKFKEIRTCGQYIIMFKGDGPMYVFDVDQMNYVSDKPTYKLGETSFDHLVYLSGAQQVFVFYDQGSAGYAVQATEAEEVASAYCIDVNTGELTPYLWHPSRNEAKQIREREEAANAPDPDVTQLLNTLKYFGDYYRFSYENFEYFNLTNNPVMLKFAPNMGSDKVYAIGRFCQGVGGITKVLALTIKNPGPNEQYNFQLLDVGRRGIVNNDIFATTQKVGGAVIELANIEVKKVAAGFDINVSTESSSGTRKKTVSVAGSCP